METKNRGMSVEELDVISSRFIDLPERDKEGNLRKQYLMDTFANKYVEFVGFIGWMTGELLTARATASISRDKAVGLMKDIAHAALWIGREDGRRDLNALNDIAI
jgi:hypothetical protein